MIYPVFLVFVLFWFVFWWFHPLLSIFVEVNLKDQEEIPPI